MRKAPFIFGCLLAAMSVGAEMGLKIKRPEMKKQAGVVTAFDNASLTVAVVEGEKAADMTFKVDPLTQFKADKKALVGKPVLVVYSEKEGKKVARVVGAPEAKEKSASAE